jgi:hypothetical protein
MAQTSGLCDRDEQFVLYRINDADKDRSTRPTFQSVALKAARIDMGPVASIERKRGVALRARDLL